MAQRRMFSKSITNSSQFLMMPQSSQNLYFHLGMNADDDGFCEHFTLMRMTESKPDDLKILQAKGFVRVFDDKVLIINNWKENNYLRNDRYTPSKYLEVYKEELKLLTPDRNSDDVGIPTGNQVDTQVRLGKDRKGKVTKSAEQAPQEEVVSVIDSFKEVNPSYGKWFSNTSQRAAISRLLAVHGLSKIQRVIGVLSRANKMPYSPTITTPVQLEDKWAALESFLTKKKVELQAKKPLIV